MSSPITQYLYQLNMPFTSNTLQGTVGFTEVSLGRWCCCVLNEFLGWAANAALGSRGTVKILPLGILQTALKKFGLLFFLIRSEQEWFGEVSCGCKTCTKREKSYEVGLMVYEWNGLCAGWINCATKSEEKTLGVYWIISAYAFNCQ